MKVLILIPVWKRSDILEIHLIGMQRFVKKSKIKVHPLYIISSEDRFINKNRNLIRRYGFEYCIYKNYPVGEKLNAGINYALENIEFDYLMNCGSDDIINPEIWKIYRFLMRKKVQFFGLMNVYFYDIVSEKCIYFEYYNNEYAIGGTRMIHIDILRKVIKNGINFYDNNKNAGLDTCSRERIERFCNIKEKVINTNIPCVLAIKSATNINSFFFITACKHKTKYVDFELIKKYFYD